MALSPEYKQNKMVKSVDISIVLIVAFLFLWCCSKVKNSGLVRILKKKKLFWGNLLKQLFVVVLVESLSEPEILFEDNQQSQWEQR